MPKAYSGRRWIQETEGARGFDAQIGARGNVSAQRVLVNEMLSGLKVGCISVAHRQAASNRGRQRHCTLAVWGPWYKAPKQRTRLHTTAALLSRGLPRLALVAEVVGGAVVRERVG